MRAVHDAVQDGIGQRRLNQPLVPCCQRQLECGAPHFSWLVMMMERQPTRSLSSSKQVAALVRGIGCQRKVVDQQQIEARELREAAREAAVAVRHKQLLQKREAHVYSTLWPARAACCPRAQAVDVERYADAPLQKTPARRAKRSAPTGRTAAAAGQRYWAIGGVQNAAQSP